MKRCKHPAPYVIGYLDWRRQGQSEATWWCYECGAYKAGSRGWRKPKVRKET